MVCFEWVASRKSNVWPEVGSVTWCLRVHTLMTSSQRFVSAETNTFHIKRTPDKPAPHLTDINLLTQNLRGNDESPDPDVLLRSGRLRVSVL